ncbi:MAG: DUF4147 domain-containing protein [Planctomycetota bacterium]
MVPSPSLLDDLLSIWTAGVDAVRAPQLLRQAIQSDSQHLTVCGESWSWNDLDRIVVVGAGKAGAGMAAALEDILGPHIVDERVTGWVNVPADCVRPLRRITLHPGRPAGVNEPTIEGAQGTARILELADSLQPRDLCLVLLSGGGSALLPAPVPGISLQDKQAVTRFLMSSGATINELNTVRKQLSRIKGGGLARACRQGRMVSLIISDVVGDPLDIIASGPTIPDSSSPQRALEILAQFHATAPQVPQSVFDVLQQAAQTKTAPQPINDRIRNVVIGNNSVALQAATDRATELGYQVQSFGSDNQGEANAVGRDLAHRCLEELNCTARTEPVCLLSGGEPIVHLTPTDQPRKGGRNQQLVLAALIELWKADLTRTAILSGGTDGEDGPTDAAGAYLDAEVRTRAIAHGLNPQSFLDACNAYSFFDPAGGLIKTGPTHTNVMDLRVALIR